MRFLASLLLMTVMFTSSIPFNAGASPNFAHPTKMSTMISLCPVDLIFGDIIQCAIDAIGEVDIYTFSGTIADKVKVRLIRTSGSLEPAIYIDRPDGTTICRSFTSGDGVDINSCTLPSNGTYRLRVEDTFRTNTGNYELLAQRLNNPDNAQPLTFDQTATGMISSTVEFDTYAFGGTAGADVQVTMTRASGAIRPRIRLYSPTGLLVCSAFGEVQAILTSCTLSETGRYMLLADDSYASRTGSYTISLVCLSSECDPYLHAIYLPIIGHHIKS